MKKIFLVLIVMIIGVSLFAQEKKSSAPYHLHGDIIFLSETGGPQIPPNGLPVTINVISIKNNTAYFEDLCSTYTTYDYLFTEGRGRALMPTSADKYQIIISANGKTKTFLINDWQIINDSWGILPFEL